MSTLKDKVDQLLSQNLNPYVPGITLGISTSPEEKIYSAAGNLTTESQFFIASSTKLYITTLILQLVDAKKVQLQNKIYEFLDQQIVQRLHIFKNKDYSNEITIQDLMSHTSGLPDYFQAQRKDGPSLIDDLFNGHDQKWDVETVIHDSKLIGAQFPPHSGLALYSDTNYQLLGKIIENILEISLAEAIQQKICKPLKLENTYLYKDIQDEKPAPLNYNKHILKIPKAMSSFGADGGIVSNTHDSLTFLINFFEGGLFDKNHIPKITAHWNKIFFPMRYGIGISLFRLPWYFSPFKKIPDLIGHSGLSGAFYYYCPDKKCYLTGTVNQIARPQTSFQLMIKAVSLLK